MQNPSVALRTDDDFAKILRRGKASRGAHGVGKLLPCWNRLSADLTGWIYCVLRPHGVDNLGDGYAQVRQFVGITQQRMAYWPAPKTDTEATPGTRVK